MKNLIDMTMTAEEAKEETIPQPSDAPEYPWGLCITLDDGSLEKLGMLDKLPAVGAEVAIIAKATVSGVRSNKRQSGEAESYVDLQITDMTVQPASALNAADVLYGKTEKKGDSK